MGFGKLNLGIALILIIASSVATATAVSGTVYRQTPPVQRSKIDRYPVRSAATTPVHSEPATPAIVYLTGGAKSSAGGDSPQPRVEQVNQEFVPRILPVLVGTTVEFPNSDPIFHNVFSYSKAKKFDLGRYPKGKSKSVLFDQVGLVKVFCEIHSQMRAYVLVLDEPLFTTTDGAGRYRIENVPPGEYTLHVWQEDLDEIVRAVTIPAAGEILIDVR